MVGIGDDAAVILPSGKYLLATTDMMVEGVHFDLAYITPYQLGFKLISVNVSDIYAMGGTPRHVLLNIAMGGGTTARFVTNLMRGVEDALNLYRIGLVGGDLSSSKSGMALSATLFGSARTYVGRAGARVGDGIYVTGTLGDSACGLHLLKKIGKTIPLRLARSAPSAHSEGMRCFRVEGMSGVIRLPWRIAEPLVRRHLLPIARDPRTVARDASAMIDVSDGLLIDLARLCDESGTGARLYETAIPVSPQTREAAQCLGLDPLTLALTGGEDYELLFTSARRKRGATMIGIITGSRKTIVDASGRERAFSDGGYQHFRSGTG